MKVKELMIGDWMQFADGNKKCTVIAIKCDARYLEDEAIITVMDRSGHWFDREMDYLKPIPLTGEILENNGFREDDKGFGHKCYLCAVPYGTGDDDDYAYLSLTDFGKYWQMEVSLVVSGTQTNIPNCCVHHVQHMLTLLGIDLEIKLEK